MKEKQVTNLTNSAVPKAARNGSRPFQSALQRAHGFYQRKAARLLFRRPLLIRTERPLISFTFDDFPRSALHVGGETLAKFDVAGTYYVSLGMAGSVTETGEQFVLDDLPMLLERGHELGCHTYSHCHSWRTDPVKFEDEVLRNQSALSDLGSVKFKTLSYPIAPPRPLTKLRMARHFAACRGGGQTLNTGVADLNHLRAFFLEKSSKNPKVIEDLISQNARERGWLIFATHDVAEAPTPYGVTPVFFEAVVRCAVNSGARILPVAQAVEVLKNSDPSGH
jgi:peptidoglycan/xylan/chitin deacetylase (PgdA/CDA1 family)